MGNHGRRLLYISYLFPPSGGVGSPRAANFARYLPRHVERAFVLTARKPATPLHDFALLEKVPPETTVYRAWNPEIPYRFRDFVWKELSPPQVRQVRANPGAAKSPLAILLSPLKWAVREIIQRIFCPDTMVTWVPFALRRARRIIREHSIDTILLNTGPYSSMFIGIALKR